MNLCVRVRSLRSQLIGPFYRLSTAPAEIDAEATETVLIDDSDNTRTREEEIEKKRNVSRLSQAHYNLVNGRRPYEVPKALAHLTIKYNRKMYGKYGAASGVNPSLCWPSKEDIEEKLEYESVAYPFTVQQLMENAANNRREQERKVLERDRDVADKYAKLRQWTKELDDRMAKKIAEVQAAKEKKERLVEEVRRHFGFKLDPRDERFQEMLVKREKEQKKKERMAKKEAKEKVMIAKLQQKNVEISDGNIIVKE